jgi:nucleoside-diphosphate-sugar epimerase
MRNAIVNDDLRAINQYSLPFAELEGRTVFISGASGFLPAYLAEALLYHNETSGAPKIQVIGLVRNAEKGRTRFRHYVGRPDLHLLVQDVCEPVALEGPADYVIHAASPASPHRYGKDPVGTLSANIIGTHNLLELARDKQSRSVLFFSSSEIYGELRADQLPCAETVYGPLDPLRLRSCYAEAKRVGEALCIAWLHQYGVPTRIVRIFHTYGPGMSLDDGRVFSDFVADVLGQRQITLKSAGNAVRAYCYLSDAVTGFLTVLLKGGVGEAYNLGNNQAAVSVRDLAARLVALFPERNLNVRQIEQPGYLISPINQITPDTTKLERLGWRPVHSIESGFRRTVTSFLLDQLEQTEQPRAA